MYKLVGCDTDSIKFSKEDGSPMTEDEMEEILQKMNDATPSKIVLEEDGYYANFLVIKSKNYVTYDPTAKPEDQMKYKGSSIMDQKKEPALKQLLFDLINDIMFKDSSNIKSILDTYLYKIHNIIDINEWTVKKTITKTLLESDRKNESRVRDALDLDTVQEGDKVWLYNAIGDLEPVLDKDGNPKLNRKKEPKYEYKKLLKTPEKYSNDHDIEHYTKRIIATLKILENVLDITDLVKYCKEYGSKKINKEKV